MRKVRILFSFIVLIAVLFVSTSFAAYKGNSLSKKEVEELFNFGSVYDLKLAGKKVLPWLTNGSTYTLIKEETNEIFWNTPSIQKTITNSVSALVNQGWEGTGYKPKDTKMFVEVGQENPKNAMEKYGFAIPNYSYKGEFPIITMDATSLVIPKGVANKVVKVFSSIFGGDIIDAPTEDTYNSLRYNTSDYVSSNQRLYDFFKENWKPYFINKYMGNGWDIKIPENGNVNGPKTWGQSLHPEANKENNGIFEGNNYLFYDVIIKNGIHKLPLEKMEDFEVILRKINEATGSEYGTVLKTIIKLMKENGAKEENSNIRIMPFEMKTLNEKDRIAINIEDPRTRDTNLILGLFPIGKIFKGVTQSISEFFIGIGGRISETTVFMNSIIDITIFDKVRNITCRNVEESSIPVYNYTICCRNSNISRSFFS